MGITPINGIPYQELTDAPNGPSGELGIANWLEAFLLTGIGAWTSWSPTVTQGAGVTVTNTRSRYQKWGRLVIASFTLVAGSSGTSGQSVSISAPVLAANGEDIRGFIQVLDTSASQNHVGMIAGSSTTTFVGVQGVGSGGNIGVTPAFALASGDILRGQVIMEAAS